MESDLSNYLETPLPYWTEEAFEVPTGLRPHVFSAGYTLGDSWLILPDDGMDAPRHREYALRCNGSGLDICMVSHADGGSSRTHVNLSDVTSIEIFSALLYCELIIHRKAAGPLRIPYNGVATAAMRQLLAPLFNAVFIRTNEKLRGTRVSGSRANATLREWCGEPGTPCESVATKDVECAMGVAADRLLLTRPATVTTASNTLVAGQVLHLVPLGSVTSAAIEDGLITIAFANTLKFSAQFENAEQACNVLAALQTAMADPALTNTPAPVTASPAMADARAELLRLIGVELSDEEAQEALDQIHRFKWIAAEKAGFDTWAVIQPGNPLRAAAVHWVRKHFSDFRAGQQGKQSVA